MPDKADKSHIVIGHHAEEKQALARQMRQGMTPAERLLWQRLRNNRLHGLHFRRQQILDGFIADFYCHAAGLVIEVDGSVHAGREDYDGHRDQVIAARGLKVLRFTNTHIETDLEGVLTDIYAAARERLR
ncbi:MAG TPA: DUF559 domain-containing protein [Chthonomonadaceae bacterium]|nr:DUF559 domain-containing protein [Chthonomonadaceae bacterium]